MAFADKWAALQWAVWINKRLGRRYVPTPRRVYTAKPDPLPTAAQLAARLARAEAKRARKNALRLAQARRIGVL